MKTIEVSVDEAIIGEVDRVSSSLSMTREDFARTALELALRHKSTIALEQQHSQGYARHPADVDDIAEWEPEQEWGES